MFTSGFEAAVLLLAPELKAGGEDRIVKCFPPRPPGSLCQGGHTASATAEQVFFSFVEVNLK